MWWKGTYLEKPMKKQYKYDAFISYRHADLDKFVAENLQKQMEWFKLPGRIAKEKSAGRTKIERVFRDKDELPLTNNLEDPIRKALEESEYLIVICSPRLKESLWCRKEIETFISLHGREKIFAVLVEGEPGDSFPDELLYREKTITEPDGSKKTVREEMEPLAADVRGKNHHAVLKAMKTEKLRLLAPMFGLSYDDLKQRHREQKLKRTLAFTMAGAAVCLVFGVVSTVMGLQIKAQKIQIQEQNQSIAEQAAEIKSQNNTLLENQALSLAEESERLLAEGDRIGALQTAVSALTEYDGIAMPYTEQAQKALSDSLYAYNRTGDYLPQYQMKTGGVVESLAVSPDRASFCLLDNAGELTLRDSQTGMVLQRFEDANGDIREGTAFLTDNRIAYINTENQVQIYDPATNETVSVSGDQRVYGIYADATGEYLAVNILNSCNIYETKNFNCLWSIEGEYGSPCGEVYFSDDSKMLAYQCRGGALTGADSYVICKNLEDGSEKVFDTDTYIVSDIKFRDGRLYIGEYNFTDDYMSFYSRLECFEMANGKRLFEKNYDDLFISDIVFPLTDSENMLLCFSSEAHVVNMQTGEDFYVSNAGIDSIVMAYAVSGSDLYAFITESGEMRMLSPNQQIDISKGKVFDCFSQQIQYAALVKGGYVVAPFSENRAVCYQIILRDESELVEKEVDRESTETLMVAEAQELAREKGYELPKLVNTVFYNDDATLTFVAYRDCTLRIYDSADQKLLAEITDMPYIASEYYGTDSDGNYYVGGSSWAYMLNQDHQNLALVYGMQQIDESGKLLLKDVFHDTYLCPVYTLDELLAMAEEDVLKYTQN